MNIPFGKRSAQPHQEKDMTLGKRIAQLRKEKNMTQEELAEQMGVSPQAVSKWENDQTCPDITLLPALAKLFDTTVDALLSGEDTAPPVVTMLPPEQRKDLSEMMLRITVDSADGDKVRINLPLSLVQFGIDMGMKLPQIDGNDALKGIDLAQIVELVRQGAVGNLIDVESADGDTVRIFVE